MDRICRYVLIPVVTIFIFNSVVCEGCSKEEHDTSIVINCNRQSLTDDVYILVLGSIFKEDNSPIIDKTADDRNTTILLECNQIRTLKSIPDIGAVTKLSFRDNFINSAEYSVFQNVWQVKTLDLGYNEFTGTSLVADIFRGAEVQVNNYKSLLLEDLNLENNNIKFLSHDIFAYLPNLKKLTLNNNPISRIDPDFERSFLHLQKLQVLSLAQTKLSSLPNTLFSVNPIKKLYLNANYFSQVPKSLQNVAGTLQYLNLNENPIEAISAESFATLTNLIELELNGMTMLKEITANAFSSLMNLKILRCAYNSNLEKIDSEAFAGLQHHSNLKEVFLNDNNLRFISQKTVDLEYLTIVRLNGNPWNCSCSLRWLLNYIETQQTVDPEANLGIRCKYPPTLNGQTFIGIAESLQCSDDQNSNTSVGSFSILKITTLILCIFVSIIFYALYYLLLIRIRRARILQTRYSGTSVKSVIKYKRAQLSDLCETQTD